MKMSYYFIINYYNKILISIIVVIFVENTIVMVEGSLHFGNGL